MNLQDLKFDELLKLVGQLSVSDVFAAIAIIVAWLSWRESKRTRLEALPNIRVVTNYEGFDSRKFRAGFMVWYFNLGVTNLGGRTATLFGLRQRKPLPIVMPVRNQRLTGIALPVQVYTSQDRLFDQLSKEPNFFEKLPQQSWEELGSLNVSIPAGETKSLTIIVIFEPEPSDNIFFLNLQLGFNNGYEHELGKFIEVSGSTKKS